MTGFEFFALLAVAFAALACLAWIADRPAPPRRPDRRISESEMLLLGLDYRDHTDAYFARKARREAIVRDVTGAD